MAPFNIESHVYSYIHLGTIFLFVICKQCRLYYIIYKLHIYINLSWWFAIEILFILLGWGSTCTLVQLVIRKP